MTILFYFLAFVWVVILARIFIFTFDKNGFAKVEDEQGFETARGYLTSLMAVFTICAVIADIIKF